MNRNNHFSLCQFTNGSNNVEYVTNKSNVPYSSVDKIAVYNGSRKKLMHCVHNFPTVSMAVFFANSVLRLIS